jgi:Ni,Fe-hydrogenase III large subunit/Ni,Fe-hydrogenase III component G
MTLETGELFPLDRALRGLRERFGDALLDADRTSLREQCVVVPAERLAEVVEAVVRDWGGTLLTLVALDERREAGRYRLHAMCSLAPQDAILTLIAAIPEESPEYPALSARTAAAEWLERENADLMGVIARGHPDPRPLVVHAGWPAGTHPLRRDFTPPAGWDWAPRFEVPAHARPGVHEIPVGPIHAGIIEPGHFRFQATGETVHAVDVRLGWTWRGLEKLAEGATLSRGLELAERVCGGCAFHHALAYCGAVEELAGVQVPPRGRAVRSLAGEVERLVQHLSDLSGLLEGCALAVGAAEFLRLKETVQQAADLLFGHRFLRGVCVPGGVTRDLDDAQQMWLRRVLAEVRADAEQVRRDALADSTVRDRLERTGVLATAVARELGATGVAARASGLALDGRRAHPYAFYRDLDFQVVTRTAGDALARFEVRADEIHESLNLIDQMILRLPGGPLTQHIGLSPAGRWGFGLVESARGLLSHWLRLDPEGRIAEWRVRSASHALWPALARSVPGNVIADFPLINKSFHLCYGCCDR